MDNAAQEGQQATQEADVKRSPPETDAPLATREQGSGSVVGAPDRSPTQDETGPATSGLAAAAQSDTAAADPDLADLPEPRPHALLGYLAISPTAGQRHTDFPARMVAYPIMPGFGPEGPQKELIKRLEGEGDWRGFALVLTGDGRLISQPIS